MAHTPGPWTLGDNEGFWNGNNCCVMADDPDVGPVVVAEVVHATAAEETDNMRLITAAPDLLAACETISDKITEHMLDFAGPSGTLHVPLSRSEIEALRAAITKAKGEM